MVPREGPLLDALAAGGVPAVVAQAPASLLKLSQRGGGGFWGGMDLVTGLWSWSRAIEREVAKAFPPRADDPVILYSNGFKAHVAAAAIRSARHVWHLHEFPPEKIGLLWKALAGAVPDATIANSSA